MVDFDAAVAAVQDPNEACKPKCYRPLRSQ